MTRQKKLRLSGSVCRVFQAPLCKGSCRRKPTEGLFFYNPSTTSWSPSPYTGEALIKPSPVGICECAKHTCRCRRDGFDLRVCEARLQASPRGVRKPRSGWRDLRVHAVLLQIPARTKLKNKTEMISHLCFFINRAAGAPFLFDLLSSLLSQKAPPKRGFLLCHLTDLTMFVISFR